VPNTSLLPPAYPMLRPFGVVLIFLHGFILSFHGWSFFLKYHFFFHLPGELSIS
jgi:hypothetical protein